MIALTVLSLLVSVGTLVAAAGARRDGGRFESRRRVAERKADFATIAWYESMGKMVDDPGVLAIAAHRAAATAGAGGAELQRWVAAEFDSISGVV